MSASVRKITFELMTCNVESNWAWHMPAMLGCSTVCPKCQHHFACCPPIPCCNVRRSLHVLSGGGLISMMESSPSPYPSPQISPSAQIVFNIPSRAPLFPVPPPIETRPDTDLKRLSDTVRALRLSGWYYEGISYQQSQELLKDKPLGTFLVRDSSDPRFLFSLSVQTERGPTSVRLHYVSENFRLDAQAHLELSMPVFPSVVDLVQHYVNQSAMCGNGPHVWVDNKGKWYSSIVLTRPLRKEQTALSLKHLTRIAIHSALQKSTRPKLFMLPPPHTELELPASVTAYLNEYPYSI